MASSAAVSQVQVFSEGGFLIDIGFEQPAPVMIPTRQSANAQRHINPSVFCLFRAVFFENNISLHVHVTVDFGDEAYCPSILCAVNLNSILAVATRSSKGKTE
jgi:hypothetical protein